MKQCKRLQATHPDITCDQDDVLDTVVCPDTVVCSDEQLTINDVKEESALREISLP
jgi:hypothetical protein